MHHRRTASLLVVALFTLTVSSQFDLVFALDQAPLPNTVSVCHDGVWDDGEYCGHDALAVAGATDMNHDCVVDALDWALFRFQYNRSGPNLSGDFNGDNIVNTFDTAVFTYSFNNELTASPCNSVPTPDVCGGTIALSFDSNPTSIDENAVQAPGVHTAYVVMDNCPGAVILEYAIQTSPNVSITNHSPPSDFTCAPGSFFVFFPAPLSSGPATVATIQYQLMDANPATLTITQLSCSQSRFRWTTANVSASHHFTDIRNAGINGPTPDPTTPTPVVCTEFGTITGSVFGDFGNDCEFDSGIDFPIAGRMITVYPGPYVAFTNGAGHYAITVPAGQYTVTQAAIADDPWTLQTCQPSGSHVVDVPGNVSGNDFALQGDGSACDVSVSIVSNGISAGPPPCDQIVLATPCPGIEHEYLFVVKGDSLATSIPAGSLLEITLDPVFTIATVTSDFPISPVSSSGPNQQIVQFDDAINPGQTCVVRVRATPSSGGPYETQMVFDDGGYCGIVKAVTLSEEDMCSCDPNDMAVVPAGCGPGGEILGDTPLTYTVRFENVGPGDAHDIFIENVLDDDLNLGSFTIVAASHPVTGVQIDPGNALVVSFDGIELPGTYDPDNNKGYVIFMVDPKENLADGTTIENTAEITFDSNDPVVTNTVLNTIQAVPCPATGVEPPAGAPRTSHLGQNYPNPFNPTTTIAYALVSRERVTISVYNVKGELVRTLVNDTKPAGWHNIVWDGRDQTGSPVASGVYMSRMHAGSFVETKKLVLLK